MTTTPTVWLDEFVTNLLTADDQSNPKIISLANGNFLVVWEDTNDAAAPGGSGTDVVGVIFDPLGNPISNSLFLNFPFGFSREEGDHTISATPDGGFVVVYMFPNAAGTETDVIFGIYDDEGTRTAQDFVQNDTTTSGFIYGNPSVAVADDGSFFVTYEKDDGTNQDIVGKKISADGLTIGAEVELRVDGFSNGADMEDILEPQTVLLTNGNFATVYTENDDNGGANERTVEVRISNADGTNSTLINNVSAPDGLPDSDPRIAALADGRFVVMWREGGNHNGRIFNNDGTESVAQFTISTNATLDFDGAEIIGLEDSSFAVALIDETDGRLFVIRYNNNIPDGGSRIVSTDAAGTGGNISNLSLDLTGDGRILLSWENGEIYTEILDPRDAGAFSAEVDDGATTDRQGQSTTITGTTDGDTIYGLDGVDTLIGGGGSDILDGGTGDDTMEGGAGFDTYFIDSGGDIVTELAGQGFDTVFTSFNMAAFPLKYANVEAFGLIGMANDLRGNDFANELIANPDVGSRLSGKGGDDTLIGGDFNDKLDGEAGGDTMRGGGGNDIYIVDNALDVVIELSGEGDDLVRAKVDYTLTANVEDLKLQGIATMGTGNSLDNIIVVSNLAVTLDGLGGNDKLTGSTQDDFLYGGTGNDVLNGKAGSDTMEGGGNDDTLRGGGGIDFLFGDGGADKLFGGTGNDELYGGTQDDELYGEGQDDLLDGGAGTDRLFGGLANDTLIGGADRDVLTGDSGADTFVFDEPHFAGLTLSTADQIKDFKDFQGDKIDLSLVDAIMGGGEDAFTFIDNAAFSGTAGELRWDNVAGNTMIYMDVDGDASADYAIRLDGLLTMSATDFIL